MLGKVLKYGTCGFDKGLSELNFTTFLSHCKNIVHLRIHEVGMKICLLFHDFLLLPPCLSILLFLDFMQL